MSTYRAKGPPLYLHVLRCRQRPPINGPGILLITALFLIAGRSIRTRYANRLKTLDPRTVSLFTIALGLTMGLLVTSYLATRARDGVMRVALASILVIVGVRLLT